MTREEFEQALDAGKIRTRLRFGALWRTKRNGKTKTWKKDPTRWEVPIKIGLKEYGTVDRHNVDSGLFVVHEEDHVA